MNEEGILIFAVAATTAFFSTLMWIRAEIQRRHADKRFWRLLNEQGEFARAGQVENAAGHNASRRVEHLESQVDQLVQQIERLTESQEFLSRVLTDRIDHLPDPRMRTPH